MEIGHVLNVEQARGFVDAIRAFVDEILRNTPQAEISAKIIISHPIPCTERDSRLPQICD